MAGAARFDVGVVQRIFSKKVYPCDIAVKIEIENKSDIKAHYKRVRDGEDQGQKKEGVSLSSSDSRLDAGEGLPPLRFGTVNDNIPEDWRVASYDKLGNFYCGNVSFSLAAISPRRGMRSNAQFRWHGWLLMPTSLRPRVSMTD